MSTNPAAPNMHLPRGWKPRVRSAMLHVISLARYAAEYTRRRLAM